MRRKQLRAGAVMAAWLAANATAGTIFISDFANNTVSTYDSTSGVFINTLVPSGAGGLDGASGVRVGPDGSLYVTSQNTNTVGRFNVLNGAFLGNFVTAGSGGLSSPQDLVFGPDGNLYVVSSANDQILRYNGQTGAFMNVFSTLDMPTHDGPINLQFGPNGNLYVTAFDGSRVLELDGHTGALLGVSGAPSATDPALVGIAFASDGDLLASGISKTDFTGAIYEYDPNTLALLGTFVPNGSGGLISPAALYVDAAGRLDVLDVANTNIVRYNGTTGAFVDTLVASGSGGLNAPLFFTVSDIPEPGTLTLLGLGLAAMLVRRRIICNRDDRYGCNPRRRRAERPLAG
jgi:streptogramin lyase